MSQSTYLWKFGACKSAFARALIVPVFLFSGILFAAPPPSASFDRLQIVVPGLAGSGWDELAHAMQRVLQTRGLVRTVDIDNLPGNHGTTGLAQFVSRHRKDPNVLLVAGVSLVQVVAANHAAVSLDEATAIARLTAEIEVLAVPTGSDPQSLDGLVQALGANPRRLPRVPASNLNLQGIDPALVNWRGVFAAPGITPEQKTALIQIVNQMVESPEWQTELDHYHWSNFYLAGDAFAQFLKDEEVRTSRLAAAVSIPPGRSLAVQMWLLRNRSWLASSVLAIICIALAYIFWQRRKAAANALNLFHELEMAQALADRKGAEAQDLARGLADQIERQLDKWGLTVAEHEVALLMLKGLRHKEIADLRGTSERTVRQQAVAIYKKAGIGGRSDLAAFFMEDLLQPAIPVDKGPAA